MHDCFGPLGGILAFLGAVGILGTLLCLPIGLYQSFTDEDALPVMLIIGIVCGLILILVVILAFVNQAYVPANCTPS